MAFFWEGNTGQTSTPQQAARKRALAESMLAQSGSGASNWGEGLARVAQALTGTVLEGRASDAERAGADEVAALLAGLSPESGFSDITAALSNPWVAESPGGSSIAQALLSQNMQRNDPMYQMQLERAGLELDALRNPVVERAPLINAGNGSIYDPNSMEWLTAPVAEGGALDQTDTMRNLEWRASQAGLVPGTDEYAQFMLSGGQGGTALSVGPDGQVSFTTGNAKPLTEAQSKDAVYFTRASGSLPIIDSLEQSLLSFGDYAANAIPAGLGNFLQSEDYQVAQNAGKEFLASILRKDTGAAVTPSEEKLYGDIFLPRPGDKPATLERKREARALALAAIEAGMPAAAIENAARALISVGLDPNASVPPPSVSAPQSQANPSVFGGGPAPSSSGSIDWKDL